MSYEISTPLTQAVIELRKQRGEFQVQGSDTARHLYRINGYRRFIADPDMDPGDSANPYAICESGLPVRAGREAGKR